MQTNLTNLLKASKTEGRAAANIGLPQWGVTCFYDSLVLNRSAVLLLNFSAKNPPLRQAEKRWRQA
jgi:hypothetical protein